MMHTGGTSIPGSSTVTAEDVMLVKPDVVSHLNGGPTAIPLEEVKKLIDETDICLEMVQCGNFKVLKQAIQWLKEKNQLDRVILGNDSPSGSGIIPLGILRSVAFIASLAGVPGEQALCMATGNTARTYELNVGIIEEGREADLVLMDAPMGSVGDNAVEALEAGDLTGISMIIIDGKVVAQKSRNTPPPKRKAVLC
jgi:enamidase